MSALIRQVAVVSELSSLSASQLTQVAAALQTQATRDFGPLWQVQANVAAFTNLNDVPLSYWPVIIEEDIKESGALGVHLDKNQQPYSLVQFNDQWTLTTSHEVLEMLADPSGNRTQVGQSPKDGQGQVQFLVEVCDPCESDGFSYQINGIMVSDFITPHFYDSVQVSGTTYSFTGAIKAPRQVLKDGYISWFDPVTEIWYQQTMFGGNEQTRELGKLTSSGASLREIIDALTDNNPLYQIKNPGVAALTAAVNNGNVISQTTKARADNLRAAIATMKASVSSGAKSFLVTKN